MSDPLPDTPTEHIRGAIPADRAAAKQAKNAFYDLLIQACSLTDACLPEHGVHLFRGEGPCLCGATNPEPEEAP